MKRRAILRASRICFVLVSAILLLCCVLTVVRVTGPSVVDLETVAEYIVNVEVDDDDNPYHWSWWGYLAVLMPEKWTINSCNYEGEIDGEPIQGVGVIMEPPFPEFCDDAWPPVPQGYERLWVKTQMHTSSNEEGGRFTARLRLNIHGSLGEYALGFQAASEVDVIDDCSNTYFVSITVRDSLLFADGFEYCDTLEWSATVP